MRLCCALVLLGIGGSLPGQVRQQVFEVADALGALEDKVGAVPGNVQPVDRLMRLLTNVLKREAKAAGQPNAAQVVVRRPRQQMLLVQGDRELCDLVQSVLDDPIEQLTLDQSRFLRNKGIILIDLNRIDEAEAALNESIRLEPNNPGARRELQYIQQLRAGHPPSGTTLTRPYAQPQPPPRPGQPAPPSPSAGSPT